MELQRVVIKAGNEFDYSAKGDIVEVHYTGWLYQAQAVDQKGREYAVLITSCESYLS